MQRSMAGKSFILGLIVIVLMLLWFIIRPPRSDASLSHTAITSKVIQERSAATSQVPAGPPRASPRPAYSEMLRRTRNYLDFARATIKSATLGDPDAQYYLGKALAFCADTYRGAFTKSGKNLTMEEATQRAVELGRSTAFLPTIFDRCHDLETSGHEDFGKPMEWFEKAANAGQPAAQSVIAVATLSKITMEPATKVQNSNSEPIQSPSAESGRYANFTTLILGAVESGDPEALWNAGRAQALITRNYDDKLINQWAWWLVSCERGLDCSSGADWVQLDCAVARDCPAGITGLEYIQSASGAKWLVVQQRAQEIYDNMASGQWNALGFTD